jgi:hypothetical protein
MQSEFKASREQLASPHEVQAWLKLFRMKEWSDGA